MGIKISANPKFIEVPDALVKKYGREGGKAFFEEINRAIDPKTRIALVLIRFPD
jgi:hypothetical protein